MRDPRSKIELDRTAEGLVFSFRSSANDGTDWLRGFKEDLSAVEARRWKICEGFDIVGGARVLMLPRRGREVDFWGESFGSGLGFGDES